MENNRTMDRTERQTRIRRGGDERTLMDTSHPPPRETMSRFSRFQPVFQPVAAITGTPACPLARYERPSRSIGHRVTHGVSSLNVEISEADKLKITEREREKRPLEVWSILEEIGGETKRDVQVLLVHVVVYIIVL